MARIPSTKTVVRINDPASAPLVGAVVDITRDKPCTLVFNIAEPKPAQGDIIVPRNTGWPSLDDRPFKVAFASLQYVTLEDSDTTGETAAVKSGATFDIQAWLELCRANVTITAPAGPVVDVTTLCDEAHRTVSALEELGTWTAAGFYDASDVALRAARDASRAGRTVFLDVHFADDSGLTFAASVNSLDTTLGINQAVSNALGGNVASQICFYLAPGERPFSTQWPWNDADLIADFDFSRNRFWSNSLGSITAAQALDCVRPSTTAVDYAFDKAGLLVEFPANTPRITDLGIFLETSSICRMLYNDDLSNPVWIKSAGMTVARDLPSPFKSGAPLGWRLTATAANATVAQSIAAIGPASFDNFTVAHGMFYWDGKPLAGPVQLTQDSFVVVTDLRPSLVAGKWVQLHGDVRALDANGKTFGVRLVAAGDSIGFMLGNITRSQTITTPSINTAGLNRTRMDDQNHIRMNNIPPLWSARRMTVLCVVVPRLFPFIPVGADAPNPERRGWTAFSFDNPYDITARGIGEISNDILTVVTWQSGAYVPNDMICIGSGVMGDTRIVSQLTSTEPGGTLMGRRGTYQTKTPQTGAGTQTTFLRSLQVDARVKNWNRLTLNAALKPDDIENPDAQRIGLTVEYEPTGLRYGFDPQHKDYVYNEINADGFSIDLDTRKGITALGGDIEYTKDTLFTSAPTFRADAETMLGCLGLVAGSFLNGYEKRLVIIGRMYDGPEMSASTAALEAYYKAAA